MPIMVSENEPVLDDVASRRRYNHDALGTSRWSAVKRTAVYPLKRTAVSRAVKGDAQAAEAGTTRISTNLKKEYAQQERFCLVPTNPT